MANDEHYWQQIGKQFPIESGVTYLNNGSFGPCPAPVIEASREYFGTLETNPQRYFGVYKGMVNEAKELLGEYVGADPGELVFITNVTVGMNMIANGLTMLQPGDEIVTTDQEYGAVRNIWDYIAGRRGCTIRTVELPLPPVSTDDIADRILRACTPATKIITMSHITSPSGMLLPVAEICALATERGIMTAIDGAHAPGMIPLDIHAVGCDFYTGNCHKWLCSPKGAGFLYVRTDRQKLLSPLIVGWGWKQGEETYLGNFENPGTQNPAMFMGVGEAIRFQKTIGIDKISARGFELSSYLRDRLSSVAGARLLTSKARELSGSLTTMELANHDAETLHKRLADERFVIAGIAGGDAPRIRISTHIYNTFEQIDRFIEILGDTTGK